MGPSSAGAIGWTQFMPSTWRKYGVDADGDGRADPITAADAIFSAANYLRASGAPAGLASRAVRLQPRRLVRPARTRPSTRARGSDPSTTATADACAAETMTSGTSGTRRVTGGGRIVPIPGFPGERIDDRMLADVAWLVANYRIRVTDGYSTSSVHDADGEHPLGLALDIVPGPGGSWDDIDRLAAWAEPRPNRPRAPFRWVGYDGDRNHGRGHHLHLSWRHAAAPHGPPAAWVDVLAGTAPP